MKRIAILLAFASCSVAAFAQTWSLGDCIEYALDQNIRLRQQQINVENAQVNLLSTKLSRLPSINGSASEYYNIGRAQNREGITVDKGSAQTSFGVNASVPVFQGMKILFQTKADKLSLAAATQDLEQARQDLSINITALYLQVLYAKEEELVARKKIEVNQDLLEKTRKMVEAGRSSESELYEAESSLAAAQSALIDAVNSRQTAILDLAQAMNYTEYVDFDIQTPEADDIVTSAIMSVAPVDTVYNDYIVRRPSVKAAELRLQQAQRNVKVAQSSYYPSLNFGASYSTGYYSMQAMASGNGSFWQQLNQNGSPSIGLSLNVPIFNKLQTRNSVRIAKNNVRNQQLALEQEKLSVYKEVQQAYVNAMAAYHKYLAGLKSEAAAAKAFEFEKMKYESGRSTAYQYNEMNTKMANASSQLAQAKYNFLLRAKILDFYRGEPLY